MPLREHHVSRLQIAMQDAVFVRFFDSFADHAGYAQRLIERQLSGPQTVEQCLAGEELHDQKEGTVGLCNLK